MTLKRKPIGQRNGLKIYKRLVAKSKLKAKKPINKITSKQLKINKEWSKITEQRIEEEHHICQWCGKIGNRTGWNFLSGHHIIKRRFNNHTKENCYISHWISCHQFIENNGIDVRIYPTKKDWENRNVQTDNLQE